ncbi:hypothetical protein KEM56_006964 [Ascosphaera pollenicola]|nr:hypothetical protein KEM56_006964 [Ascosphaera pollenicola]
MAANEYYNPSNLGAGVTPPSYHSRTPSPFHTAGAGHDNDFIDSEHYADNIPLKSAQAPDPREVIPPPNYAGASGSPPASGAGAYPYMNTQYMPAPTNPPPAPMVRAPPARGGFFSFKRKIPWFCYLVTVIQIIVFIVELVKNGKLTGSPIMIHPQFSPMIGPSPYVQINMGARFVPCMRNEHNVQDSTSASVWPCPNVTSSDATDSGYQCSLSELCGMNGVPNPTPGGTLDQKPAPNQWFRFIIPMFLHAGFIHIGFNLLTQLSMGVEKERQIGTIRFALIYLAAGIFGFILGGNFAAPMIASTGCSGSLFGIIALDLLDLFYSWRSRPNPVCELMIHIVTIVISLGLGLLPGLDNFSHIGGFAVGLVLGIVLLRSPDSLRQRLTDPKAPYEPMSGSAPNVYDASKRPGFLRAPVEFFKGRKLLWWVWWIVRAVMLVLVLLGFILLLNNFYTQRSTCKWCKYLSCIPVKNWCDLGELPSGTSSSSTTTAASSTGSAAPSGIQTGDVTVSPNARRGLLGIMGLAAGL